MISVIVLSSNESVIWTIIDDTMKDFDPYLMHKNYNRMFFVCLFL